MFPEKFSKMYFTVETPPIVNSMRNSLDGAAPENAKQAFSGGFAATGETDFELIHYNFIPQNIRNINWMHINMKNSKNYTDGCYSLPPFRKSTGGFLRHEPIQYYPKNLAQHPGNQ